MMNVTARALCALVLLIGAAPTAPAVTDSDNGAGRSSVSARSHIKVGTLLALQTHPVAVENSDRRVRDGVFNVRSYGAKLDGVTDDTSAFIRAHAAASAAGGGEVFFSGSARINASLDFGAGSGQNHVSLRGDGAVRSQLLCHGTSYCLKTIYQKYVSFADFGVVNVSGSKGTTTGIWLSGSVPGGGTQTGQDFFRNVIVQGFHWGIMAGDISGSGIAASEIHFTGFSPVGNDVGFISPDFNSLNFTFNNTNSIGNGVSILCGAGACYVYGFSSSGDDTFFKSNNHGTHVVDGGRMELGGLLADFQGAGTQTMTVRGVAAVAPKRPDKVVVSYGSGSGVLTVQDCFLHGKIQVDGSAAGQSWLRIVGTFVADTEPFRQNPLATVAEGLLYTVRDSGSVNPADINKVTGRFPDESGVFVNAAGGRVPFEKFYRSGSLPTSYVRPLVTFVRGDATPSVAQGEVFKTDNSWATMITNFDNGIPQKEITIIFTEGNTTVQHNSKIRLAGGVNFAGAADDVLVMIFDGAVWREKSRSLNRRRGP